MIRRILLSTLALLVVAGFTNGPNAKAEGLLALIPEQAFGYVFSGEKRPTR
jgi:hypothetical protein